MTAPTLPSLPTELLLHILSFCGPAELIALSQTCTTLRRLIDTEEFWQATYQQTAARSRVVCGLRTVLPTPAAPAPSLNLASSSVMQLFGLAPPRSPTPPATALSAPRKSMVRWKRLLRLLVQANTPNEFGAVPPHGAETEPAEVGAAWSMSRALLPRTWRTMFQPARMRIPVLGFSKSKLLDKLMWAPESPLHLSGLAPGVSGVGSGVMFTLGPIEITLSTIHGLRVLERNLDAWTTLFGDSDGYIVVVEVNDAQLVPVARDQLQRVVGVARSPDVPILVVALNDRAENTSVHNSAALAESLNLHELQHPWRVYDYNYHTESIAALGQGLLWLTRHATA
eukprot:TRINITY_DN3255_c0_g1_i1.p1 TRINITY_DN3255_c0_g1~~TRINITY_DN3255_c0_g1_i1.p1  ORF type:complete len:378 (+),score=75.32 TRINITY_DN3255_c0_g1_i1:117-1136(+)